MEILSLVSVILCLLLSISLTSCRVNITVAVLVERSPFDFPFNINRTQGLIKLAIKRSRAMVEHSASLDFIVEPCDVPNCVALKWGALFCEIYHKYKPDVVIGPGCTPSVQTVSRMATSWNIPHLTYAGTDESLDNKSEFSMLTRMSYTMNLLAKFYVEVFDAFGWTNIANIYDSREYLTNLVGTSLQRMFNQEAPHIISYDLPFSSNASNLEVTLRQILAVAATKSRVFLVSCHGDKLRRMALLAQDIGLTVGEYVFIFFFQLHGEPAIGKYTWRRGDNLDEIAKLAYESVMVIRPRRPNSVEFDTFERQVKDSSITEYNFTWKYDNEVSIYNIGHYDSFILYAHALNETLVANEDPRNGQNIRSRMWNRTFPGIGGRVFVNENGDRDTDFTLLDLDPDTGQFQVVAQYLGWRHKFELITDIHWPKNKGHPPNMPVCGYTGDLCVSFSFPPSAIVGICLSSVIVLVMIGSAIVYRKLKADASIDSDWWKVKVDDVVVHATSSFFSTRSKANDDGSVSVAPHATSPQRVSMYKANDNGSFSLAPHATSPQRVGMYKGTQVHIRRPKTKSLYVDRNFLIELKQGEDPPECVFCMEPYSIKHILLECADLLLMRDITCPNLTRLIGVCPDPGNIHILTEHCSRGSLQDILHSESIQLDWDFRTSLINDIVEGMYYLHNSPIAVHGRLTSSHCVIDSRFVLKITGFGLRSIDDVITRSKQIYTCMPELLWMAPEHLRTYPTRPYSQAGDVYSFAIILYEMCTRTEPYVNEIWYKSVEETVRQIKRGGACPLRPTLDEDESNQEIAGLAKSCWQENPIDRPSFDDVKKTVRDSRTKQKGSLSGKNVLDVLLHRMEQYANNLEGLVEDRTNAFLEEKKKSEELLYQVLPRSVADQLRVGQSVHPESYESVTIYFSDIVGFTAISASSSPFQIVDLLNDLYTCFDQIIDNFDVYKVETIGDAYMVVSGLPDRNGVEHVRHIARMALEILRSVRTFTIRHQPDTPLKARIGIHSGPVCAGVVGRKMPRYCLFGDTVNTASRMESNGEAMKIHISKDTRDLLGNFCTFAMEERGLIRIKGKGTMQTYWLKDEHGHISMNAVQRAYLKQISIDC